MSTQMLTGTQMVQKKFITGRIRALTAGHFITDGLFMYSPSNAREIGYEENPKDLSGQYPADKVRERGEFGEYPRIAMSASEKAAIIRDYGLEALVSNEAVRFNKVASIDRTFQKLAGAVIRYVDTKGFKVLTDGYNASSTLIHTLAVTTAWTQAGAKAWNDAAAAAKKIKDSGYDPDTWTVSPDDWLSLYQNDEFRKAIDQDVPPEQKALYTGKVRGRVAGLVIVEAANLTAGYSVVAQAKILGNREQTSQDVETDSYYEPKQKATAVQAFREVVHVLTDPGAVCLIGGVR